MTQVSRGRAALLGAVAVAGTFAGSAVVLPGPSDVAQAQHHSVVLHDPQGPHDLRSILDRTASRLLASDPLRGTSGPNRAAAPSPPSLPPAASESAWGSSEAPGSTPSALPARPGPVSPPALAPAAGTPEGNRPAPTATSAGGPQLTTAGTTTTVSTCVFSYTISNPSAAPSSTTIGYQGTAAECQALEETLDARLGQADPANPGWTVVAVGPVTDVSQPVTSNDLARPISPGP